MEKIKLNPENEEGQKRERSAIDFEGLWQEIAAIKNDELAKKERGEKYNPHFQDFCPSELTEEDLEIYQEFRERRLDRERFLAYQRSMLGRRVEEPLKDTRMNFMGWLVNQLMGEENLKWFDPEEYEKLFGAREKK